jgi:hypothetical protein
MGFCKWVLSSANIKWISLHKCKIIEVWWKTINYQSINGAYSLHSKLKRKEKKRTLYHWGKNWEISQLP